MHISSYYLVPIDPKDAVILLGNYEYYEDEKSCLFTWRISPSELERFLTTHVIWEDFKLEYISGFITVERFNYIVSQCSVNTNF
jgi:hypothetical protein